LGAPEDEDGDGGEKGGGRDKKAAEPVARTGNEPDPQLDRAVELLKSWNVFKTVVAQNQP
jgi:hypothetical protein